MRCQSQGKLPDLSSDFESSNMAKRSRDGTVTSSRAFQTLPVDQASQKALQKLLYDMVFRELTQEQRSIAAVDTISLDSHLSSSEYQVCEKSDGERRMLLLLPPGAAALLPSGGAFLASRAFQFELLPESSMYMSLFGGSGPTLVDGELLLHSPAELQDEMRSGAVGRILQASDTEAASTGTYAPQRATFLMFDAVAVAGRPVGALCFQRRLEALGEVRLAYKKLEHAISQEQGTLKPPLVLMSKRFWPSRDVEQVFRHVKELMLADGSKRKIYSEGARCNLNDGAVFTPVHASYTSLMAPGGDTPPLLKWKSAEDSTVDFSVPVGDLREALRGGGATVQLPLCLSTGGSSAPVKVSHLRCAAAAAGGMLAAAEGGGLGAVVLECALGRAGWRVVRLRPGKARGNHVFVGWHTLQILAMPVTQQALCAALRRHKPAPPTAPAAAAAASGSGGAST